MRRALEQSNVSESEQQIFWEVFFGKCCPSDSEAAKDLLNEQDEKGQTCLQVAVAAGREEVAEQMKQWGAGKSQTRVCGAVARVSFGVLLTASLRLDWTASADFLPSSRQRFCSAAGQLFNEDQ